MPVHLQYPEPDPRDAEYEGRHELYSAAVELWNAYLKNHETKVKIQAKAIKHAIGDHPVASAFVKHNNIDPRQILADMDRAFLQNSHMTKGTALFDFWSLSKGSEPWSVFFAKQDILQMDAHTMFDYQFTDDDKASVLQMNLPTHLQPMYAQFVSSGKSYNQIREELIALETLEKRTRKAQAHAVRDFVHSRYDNNHVPRDAPQSYNWRNRSGRDGRGRSSSPGASRSTRFGSRSHSPDRRGRSHSPKDFSYRSGGYASSHDFRGSSPSRRFGRGERSSSRSPNSTHGAKSGIQSQSFNRDKGKPGQPAGKSVQHHPRSGDTSKRARSPSPAARPKQVGFRRPVAQTVTDHTEQPDTGEGRDAHDDVDPDLAYSTGEQDEGDTFVGTVVGSSNLTVDVTVSSNLVKVMTKRSRIFVANFLIHIG